MQQLKLKDDVYEKKPYHDSKHISIGDINYSSLSSVARMELSSLDEAKAHMIGDYLAMSYAYLDADPNLAFEEAQKAVKHASHLALAREVLGLAAYRIGDYKKAITELKAARRINGVNDYLPIIADSYRGLGQPEKVFEIAVLPDIAKLDFMSHIEMSIILAGAYADFNKFDAAHRTIKHELRRKGLPIEIKLRLMEAHGTFYEQESDFEKARIVWEKTNPIRQKYEETTDEILFDYDLLERNA